VTALHNRFAAHDQGDYDGLAKLQAELTSVEDAQAELEFRWLELTEMLGG